MVARLRITLLTCLIFLTSPLCDEESATAEAPPTQEEIQAALDKISKWFTGRPSRPAVPVKQPEWYPLEPDDAKRVAEVLTAWSASRTKEGRLRCQFRQWEYDPDFGPKDPAVPYVHTTGDFRWDAPNVWMWGVNSVQRGVASGDKTEWKNEYPKGWARKKDTLYELDYRKKTCTEHQFPDGVGADFATISFLGCSARLGVDMELLRLDPTGLGDRFWVRPVTPKEGITERWLELVPRKDADARRFSSLVVAISESDWDISAIDIRAPNYSAETYPARTTVEFLKRTRPPMTTSLLMRVLGGSESCVPSVPAGWKTVLNDYRPLATRK